MKKQVISKPSNTVVLCYLEHIARYVGFFSEINFISVGMIVSTDFL